MALKLSYDGLNRTVAAKLKAHDGELDQRSVEALKEFSQADALTIIGQFETNKAKSSNKGAFLCGIVKTFKAKMKTEPATVTAEEKAEENTEENTEAAATTTEASVKPEEKVQELLSRTGYALDITNGMRKYGGPPPGWEGSAPGVGGGETEKFVSQIYLGKFPLTVLEDELVPLLEEYGQIYELRLMMNKETSTNKGFCFCTYSGKEAASEAVAALNDKEWKGRKLVANLSKAKTRIFVGSVPKVKTKENILAECSSHSLEGVIDVVVYASGTAGENNRGFCFIDFDTHVQAADAKKKIERNTVKLFNHVDVPCSWAEDQDEPSEEIMAKVKNIFVKNLAPSVTDETLTKMFEGFGSLDKLEKKKDYAFIFFNERSSAEQAIAEMNGQEIDGLKIDVSLAKPRDNSKRKARGGGMRGAPRGGPRGGLRGGPPTGPRGRGGPGLRGGFRGGFHGYDAYGYDGYYAGYGPEYGAYGPPPMAYGPPRGGPRGGPPRGGPPRGGPMRGAPRGMHPARGGRGGPMAGAKRPMQGGYPAGPHAKQAAAWYSDTPYF